MDKMDPPRSFGVFKPAGHTVVAFPEEAALHEAQRRLQLEGVPEANFTIYTPDEMLAQCDTDLVKASAFAAVGQELNLVKLHRELAQRRSHFLVVKTASDEQAHLVAECSRACGAVIAQQYGTFTIEDLIDPADGKGQVFESPDRGLDSKVSSHPDSA